MAVYEMKNGFALLKQKKILKKKKKKQWFWHWSQHHQRQGQCHCATSIISASLFFRFQSLSCPFFTVCLFVCLLLLSFFYWLYKVILLFFFSLLIVSWWVLELGILAFKRTRQFIYYGRWPEQSKILDSVFNPIIDEFINSLNGC